MKKRNVLNLIKYHVENDDYSFRNEARQIARDFDANGDSQLSGYIMSMLSDATAYVPQSLERRFDFLELISDYPTTLPLPNPIMEDIIGVLNAIQLNAGINKFLLEGPPGTGKTESAKLIAKHLSRKLYSVTFDELIDSKLGQTAKNISNVFDEINKITEPTKCIILFDEIDALAMNRIADNDLREMGRATSALLKGFDSLNNQIVIIATTNLYSKFDRALIRCFDAVIGFERYTRSDLIEVADSILASLYKQFDFVGKNTRLFNKILELADPLPYPGELHNMLKSSIAFSNPENKFDYLRKLYKHITGFNPDDIIMLNNQHFTVREIEVLTGISKSTIARNLKEV